MPLSILPWDQVQDLDAHVHLYARSVTEKKGDLGYSNTPVTTCDCKVTIFIFFVVEMSQEKELKCE